MELCEEAEEEGEGEKREGQLKEEGKREEEGRKKPKPGLLMHLPHFPHFLFPFLLPLP